VFDHTNPDPTPPEVKAALKELYAFSGLVNYPGAEINTHKLSTIIFLAVHALSYTPHPHISV
jgi:hypothetical protein